MKIHKQFTDSLSKVLSDKTGAEHKANRDTLAPSRGCDSKGFSPLH